MAAEIKVWPKQGATTEVVPQSIFRPCDAGLVLAVDGLETQLGTIEAYNRIVGAALALKRRIDAGDIKPQNPIYAVNIRG